MHKSLTRLIAIVALSTLLGACAPTMWTRPGTSDAEWRVDQYACERDARMSAISFGGGISGAIEAKRFHDKCLEVKGYTRAQ